MALRQYIAKRNFRATHEPRGKLQRGHRQLTFVVQKHAARRLHYDFRLEMEGVLKSWAVPNGFPTTKGDKRLAVHVEDHPMDYAHFEGIIPEDNYGAGTVMVWDTGTYEDLGGDPQKSLETGKLHITLHGKKLKGEWTLVKMRPRNGKDEWLIIKTGQDMPSISGKRDDQSVLTRRTMKRIAADQSNTWKSNRRITPSAKSRIKALVQQHESGKSIGKSLLPARAKGQNEVAGRKGSMTSRTTKPRSARRLARAEFITPMKVRLVDRTPRGADWIYEIKFDGVRAIAVKNGNDIELYSRNHLKLAHYDEINAAIRELPADTAVIDGEIVALDEQGRSLFQLLQSVRNPVGARPPVFYYVFDLLHLDGESLLDMPLEQRKRHLQKLVSNASDPIRFSSAIEGDPDRIFEEIKKRGLEGIVAKRNSSYYCPGQRAEAWQKIKCVQQQEFVIGGYTEPKGARSYFGSVLVGYYEEKSATADKKLMFAAAVGTGFNHQMLKSLHARLQKMRVPECPFANLPHASFSRSDMRRSQWVEPKLVCEVKFSEWTRDANLRQPVFLGPREDKSPEEVIRERPA
jgi:bifunctional non-homologous end joining protein LigD